jgi:hypothetical protein
MAKKRRRGYSSNADYCSDIPEVASRLKAKSPNEASSSSFFHTRKVSAVAKTLRIGRIEPRIPADVVNRP